jgi:hypothetical protein
MTWKGTVRKEIGVLGIDVEEVPRTMYTRKEADRISVGLTPETQAEGMVIGVILEGVLEEMIGMKMKVVGDYIVNVIGTPRVIMSGTVEVEVEGGQ